MVELKRKIEKDKEKQLLESQVEERENELEEKEKERKYGFPCNAGASEHLLRWFLLEAVEELVVEVLTCANDVG